jgi:methyl-accepting chemotaxis protein
MFAVLLVSIGGILVGALRATQAQSDAGTDLARVAAVQRSLDRALTLQASIGTPMAQGAAPSGSQNLVLALRAQLEATWALPATPEVAAITDSLRQPAAQYFQSIETYLRGNNGGDGASWAFADLEPRRVALESGLREAMTRMRVVLQRVETRVLAEADRSDSIISWVIGGGLFAGALAAFMLLAIARSIQHSIHAVGEVAQALAAGDMDNRCEPHGNDEVSALARMINLLADTMQGMLTRLRSEASRSSFSNQLVEALEMADSEAEADKVIARAMNTISDVHPMELLLADSSRAHLERACVHPKTGASNCSVDSPYSCIAVRRGHPQLFPDAEALNAWAARCPPPVCR